jgi:hypothetical protein
MAEHPQEHEQEKPQSVAKLTAEIVVAYVTRNTVAPTDLGDLMAQSPVPRCPRSRVTSISSSWSRLAAPFLEPPDPASNGTPHPHRPVSRCSRYAKRSS